MVSFPFLKPQNLQVKSGICQYPHICKWGNIKIKKWILVFVLNKYICTISEVKADPVLSAALYGYWMKYALKYAYNFKSNGAYRI